MKIGLADLYSEDRGGGTMTYAPVLQPYAHQVAALDAASGRRVFCWNMAMRTGKSLCVLTDFGRMADEGEVLDLLVIAPAGTYDTWYGEIVKHVPPEFRERLLFHRWTSGGGSGHGRRLEWFLSQADPRRPRVLVVNVEALSTVERAREACFAFVRSRGAVVVVSESTSIKGLSKRTEWVLRIGELARYRRIESGLMTPRSPLDLYSQFEFLDRRILGFQNFFFFKLRHAVTRKMTIGARNVNVVVGYRHVEELRDKIAPHVFRVRLEDCYDVPKKLYVIRDVSQTPEQRRIYAELKEHAFADMGEGRAVSATRIITRMLRLHQVNCGHVVDDDERVSREIPENRTAALLDVLREYEGKAIVWASYDHDVRKIVAALEREFGAGCAARFWGGNRSTREAEEARFKSDPACPYMVATPAAGGRGRTWAHADLMIYWSNQDNLEWRDQSEERGSGIGKERPMTLVDLMVRGTVDEKIVGALRKKINLAAVVTGENARDWLI